MPHLVRVALALSLFTACGDASHELPALPALDGIDATAALDSGWIHLAAVDDQSVPSRIDAPGRLIVRHDADARLSAPVAGRVREVLVREGARVREGDALLRLESPEAAVARAEVTALGIDRRAAQAELERQQRLAASGVGLPVELLRAEADVARVEASLRAARSRAALVGDGHDGEVVLRAPADGVVVDLSARPGLSVGPEAGSLLSLAQSEALQVRLEVYEDELQRVTAGQRVAVSTSDGSAEVWGEVVEVAGAADPERRRGPVLVELDALPQGWVAGRHLRGRIDAAPASSLAVPVAAVVIRPDRSRVVYVEEGPVLVQRPVQVGRVVDGAVPVLAGLRAGERVVVDGALLIDAMADRLL